MSATQLKWTPQDDITALENAQLFPMLLAGLSVDGSTNAYINEGFVKRLPEPLQRHFSPRD